MTPHDAEVLEGCDSLLLSENEGRATRNRFLMSVTGEKSGR